MVFRKRYLMGLLACLGALALLGPVAPAAAQSPSPFVASSPEAETIRSLMIAVLWIAVIVFVVVEALLLWATWRYRARANDESLPAQVHGNTPLEIAWTAAPAVVLAIVVVLTIRTMGVVAGVKENAVAENPLLVKVIAHQWWWEVQYPELDVITAADIHVPVGRPVQFELTSSDVIHSFWVPELMGKTDSIPGRTNHLQFTASRPGEYLGLCTEFCGLQHAQMRFRVIASAPETFDAWVAEQQAPVAEVATAQAQEGRDAFMSRGCAGCHTINGTGAQGTQGPNLTHFASRRTIGAGALENTPENLARWIRNPQDPKPGALMPNLNLPEETIEQLVAYLESLE
ncbi:MAG TPA: cytochrome c oxidase subunit II [Ardenticatenaceae bacterium]|nr:cytochrome c oxidase subunit II [Ardenticatenaceae bacterium]